MAVGYGTAQPKGKTRQQIKGRKDRTESKVKKLVRSVCVIRDGRCRVWKDTFTMALHDIIGWCEGESQWAHMHSRRRSQTRGQAPDVRHDSRHSFMLCRFHHDAYDARSTPRLLITALTRQGADGPLKFRRAKT